jgi:hypothetical protein
MLWNDPLLAAVNAAFFWCVVGLNIFGLLVTQILGSVFRAVMLTARTASVRAPVLAPLPVLAPHVSFQRNVFRAVMLTARTASVRAPVLAPQCLLWLPALPARRCVSSIHAHPPPCARFPSHCSPAMHDACMPLGDFLILTHSPERCRQTV